MFVFLSNSELASMHPALLKIQTLLIAAKKFVVLQRIFREDCPAVKLYKTLWTWLSDNNWEEWRLFLELKSCGEIKSMPNQAPSFDCPVVFHDVISSSTSKKTDWKKGICCPRPILPSPSPSPFSASDVVARRIFRWVWIKIAKLYAAPTFKTIWSKTKQIFK